MLQEESAPENWPQTFRYDILMQLGVIQPQEIAEMLLNSRRSAFSVVIQQEGELTVPLKCKTCAIRITGASVQVARYIGNCTWSTKMRAPYDALVTAAHGILPKARTLDELGCAEGHECHEVSSLAARRS